MSNRNSGANVPDRRLHARLVPGVALASVALISLLAPVRSIAQSTGTEAVESELLEVTVTARRGPRAIGPVLEQTASKSRISISGEFLSTQAAGQSVMQSLNQVPGVNFTNSDAYGTSGGNLRIRGFDGSRVSVTFDGIPLNDSGNYALFTNQLLDPELIAQADVNLGTTDVDSPTASATGGTVAYRSRRPANEFGGVGAFAVGSDSFVRGFGMIDTGEFGPWKTTAFVAGSYSTYDKFKGPGDLEKKQINARLFQDLGGGDFISLGLHFNTNRNAFYRTASAASYAAFGRDYDNLEVCSRDAPTAGVADNDNATPVASTPTLDRNDNLANTSSCSNFYGVRINPSDTGNLRGQALFHLGEKFRLTIDPSFQYVLANGGGSSILTETPSNTTTGNGDRRLVGTSTVAGVDLNGDGDILDSIRFYSPNTTNTRRYGLSSSLIWDLADDHRLRLAYTLDYARHRQTAQWGLIGADGSPENVFAGRNGLQIKTADGNVIRGRDRYSVAKLNQIAAEYRGEFLDQRLITTIGLRLPEFTRNLNQYCYTPNGGSGNSGNITSPAAGGTLCTTQVPVATRANGNVVFTTATNALEYIPPYNTTLKFDDVLPNAGLTYKIGENQSVYLSYAEGLSAPRTDNLYAVRRRADNSIGRAIPEPETTKAYDIGWRYNSPQVLASVALWKVDYANRIVAAFDPDLGFSVDRNLGEVKIEGLDVQVGWQPIEKLTLSASASFNDSEVQNDVPASTATGAPIPTKGKALVEVPRWTYATRLEFRPNESLSLGLQGKRVGDRFSTDTNNEIAPGYTVWDLDARLKLPGMTSRAVEVQLNVINLFDQDYFGNISSGTGVGTSVGFFSIGAPRTVVVSVRTTF